MSDDWLKTRTKATLLKTVITVSGKKDGYIVPITLQIDAVTLNYAPLIHYTIKCDVPYYEKDALDWDDHPFRFVKSLESSTEAGNIIDDTEATRALIMDLAAEPKKMYTTTDCSHKGRLISALSLFWS